MKKTIYFSIYLLFLLYSTNLTAQTTRYVKETLAGNGSGDSWSNASNNLQAMINASAANDIIWVASGTYKPTEDPFGNPTPIDPRDKTIYLKDGVSIYGGFIGTETLLSERNWLTNATILSGDLNGDDIGFTNNAENTYHVLLSVSDLSTTMLDGFIIKCANADGGNPITVETKSCDSGIGGGILNVFSSPTLKNIRFIDNFGNNAGGAIANDTGSPMIMNCVFVGNKSNGNGGGIVNQNASPTISNCAFHQNVAEFFGGAISNELTSSPTITNSTFSKNMASLQGGAMANNNATPTTRNCTFSRNSAGLEANAIFNNDASPSFTNCIIWANTGGGTEAFYSAGTSNPTIEYSDVEGTGIFSGTGNINSYPIFADTSDINGADNIWFTGDDGLRLACVSPVFNAGTNAAMPPLDILGNPMFGANKDMGAYESQFNLETPIAPTIAFTTSGNNSIILCGGTSVTMTCPTLNVYEYLWYKNGAAINYVLSPNNDYTVNISSAGTDIYTLEVTYTGGICLSTQSNALSIVKSVPNATITPSGPTTFCANVPTTLSTTAGMTTYSWYRGNLLVGTNSASYTPNTNGNHKVTVTDANNCSKASSWLNINVKPLPSANAGMDKNVCQGSSVQIGTTSSVGNTYTWSPNIDLSNAYIANPMTSTTNNTTYTLTVNNTSSGCSNTDNVMINSLFTPQTPSLTSTLTPVCQGTSISISPFTSGAASVDWYKGGVFLYNKATNFTQIINLATPTSNTYTIKAKAANGCSSGFSNSLVAWVQQAATPTLTTSPSSNTSIVNVCVPSGSSGSATLTASSTTPSPTYSWSVSGSYVATGSMFTQPVTLAQNNRLVSVQASYPNGCLSAAASKIIRLVTSGCVPRVNGTEIAETDMITYPNPASDILQVEITNSETNAAKLLLYNSLGQIVYEKEIPVFLGKAHTEIDIRHLAAGMYMLSCEGNIQKVMKE